MFDSVTADLHCKIIVMIQQSNDYISVAFCSLTIDCKSIVILRNSPVHNNFQNQKS